MKQVYIVSDGSWLLGVFRSKAGAKECRKLFQSGGYAGIYIKRRYDTLQYLNVKD